MTLDEEWYEKLRGKAHRHMRGMQEQFDKQQYLNAASHCNDLLATLLSLLSLHLKDRA